MTRSSSPNSPNSPRKKTAKSTANDAATAATGNITNNTTSTTASNAATAPSSVGDAEERLSGLLADLNTLHDYLRERGQRSYKLAQYFLANAQKDASSRAYDERQAAMLGYQHEIWHEMAGRVYQLLVHYGDDEELYERDEREAPPTAQETGEP